MKKLSSVSYSRLFFKHLWRFLTSVATPRELAGNHAVAVSGGLDSMALLSVAERLHREGKIGPVRALFVDHRTRSGQRADGDLVRRFCAARGIPFTELVAGDLLATDANFEARARRERRRLCLGALAPAELLWVGHHLDDSYEWSFMQRHRSTDPRAALGIPVRNRRVLRPFLCVTRAQITRLGRTEDLPYREDPTNADRRFDRNYVRHEVLPAVRARYPRFLKCYAHAANAAAALLGVAFRAPRGSDEVYAFADGAALCGRRFSAAQVRELLHRYSRAGRGELGVAIERMLRAIENHKKGPFQFSGGLEAYYSPGLLMVYRRHLRNADAATAEALAAVPRDALEALGASTRADLERAWRELLARPDALANLPGLVVVLGSEAFGKTLNTSVYDPLFPEVSRVCRERGLRFVSTRKCLDTWTQKRERLPEMLRLLPLYNLSDLFSSQR